ncbi:MAG: ribosome biogenesis GTP-binding protein YihA/YsxC, partial [Burkholderiales bacterium]
MTIFQHAAFHTTVNHLQDLPPEDCAEVAFVGRSNAGKSSAINALANRTRLAFVSKTPGRTQHINYFSLGDNRFLVDLPGYGFANVPLAIKDHWEKLVGGYLATRQSLRGLIIIMDIRHPLRDTDRDMIEWFTPSGKPIHILLSKADKLSKQDQHAKLKEVEAELHEHFPHCSVQLFSSPKRMGLEQAEAVVTAMLNDAPEEIAAEGDSATE